MASVLVRAVAGRRDGCPQRKGASARVLVKVLIYDQFPLVRHSLCALLDALPDIDVVATTDDVREATTLVRSHRPAVVLIGGATLRPCVELIRAVNGERPEPMPHCLVFYQELTYGVMAELLRAGAKGLLNRDAD